MLSDSPWMKSEKNPQTKAHTIVNAQGRVIAAMVPNTEDADFIVQARNRNRPSASGIQIGIKLEALHEHIGSAWSALAREGRTVGDCEDRPKFAVGTPEYHLDAVEKYANELFQLLALISPAVGDT
jgi:hypothetical protein